jgi:hypothetical protein
MTRPVDPYVVSKLAECIELLPKYINSPQKMPFVQEVIQRALEQVNSDREALAQGHESLARGDEVGGQRRKGKKYRYERGGDPLQAEKYREPVTSVWLSDSDKEALKDGFEEDETGVFESFEGLAADIGEWVKECRRPRDAELFRSRLSFVCGEALLYSQGVEVSPGVYKLDLGHWEAEVAKPFCDDLRQFADEMATEPKPLDPLETEEDGPIPDDGFRWQNETYKGITQKPWLALKTVWFARHRAVDYDDFAKPVLGECELDVTESMVNGWQRALNHFFQEKGLPFHLAASKTTRIAKLVMRPEEIREKIC